MCDKCELHGLREFTVDMYEKVELHVPNDNMSRIGRCKRLHHVLEDFTIPIYIYVYMISTSFTVLDNSRCIHVGTKIELHLPKDAISYYTCPISASFTFFVWL